MKLATATDYSYSELKLAARQAMLAEEGAPRWSFDYANPEQDANPDVLVLGDYVHPGTGNQLVGGINLNYVDEQQLQQLQQVLPQIMRGADLKHRYHLGKALLPEVFDNFYRTYRSDLITGVQPDELEYWEPDRPEPTPTPRQPTPPPVEPVPPPEFSPQAGPPGMAPQAGPPGMAPQAGPPGIAPQPPPKPLVPGPAAGPPAARQPLPRPPKPVPRPAVRPLPPELQARLGGPPRPQGPTPAPQDPSQMDLRTLAQAYKQRIEQVRQQQAQRAEQMAQRQAIDQLRRERQKNLQDLTAPAQGDPLEPAGRQGRLESIEYYSPAAGRYITEQIQL